MILIVFNQNIPDFINNPQILSEYRTQTIFNNGGDGTTDNFKLEADDEAMIKKYMKAACAKIAVALSGYTKGIYDTDGVMEIPPYLFDTTYLGVPNQILYRINMPDSFIVTNIAAMDEAMKDAIENYILYRTAKLRGTEFQSYQSDWENALNDLRGYLHHRYETTKRNMNLF